MARAASFRNRLVSSAGLALTMLRPWTAMSESGGTAVAANVPYYYDPIAFAPPPTVTTLSSTNTTASGTANIVMGCGTWSDGTPATIQYINKTGANTDATVVIRVNSDLSANSWDTIAGLPTADQARVKSIGAASGAPDLLKGSGTDYGEDAAVRHVPTNGIIFRGLAVMTGYVANVAGGTTGGCFCAVWNETASRWELLYRTPAYNVNATKGNNWIRPKINFLSDPATATEAIVSFVDYTAANVTDTVAGTIVIFRIHGAAGVGPWATDTVVEVARPDYDTTAENGGTQTHIHDAIVRKWGANGMVVVATIGHGETHSMHGWFRADTNYVQGYTQSGATVYRDTITGVPALGEDQPQGINPTSAAPVASKTHGATQNGWTTNRYLAGDLTLNPPLFNPQYMSLEPVSDPTKFLASTDEAAGPCVIITLPAVATDKITATRCRDTGFTSFRSGWVTWGVTRPDPAVYATYATLRAPDNVSTSPTPNVALRPVAIGGVTRSGTVLTVVIPGVNIPASVGATVTLSGFTGGDTVFNGTFTAVTGSGPGVLVASVANSGITTNTTAGLASVTHTQRTCSSKVIVSGDGTQWAEVYAPGNDAQEKTFVLGWHGPTKLIVGVNTRTSYQLRVISIPTIFSVQPLAASPAVVNYAQNVSSLGSMGGTNTCVDVTSTYFNADAIVAGRTIPKAPGNGGPVWRATSNGNGVSGNVTICAEVRPNGSTNKEIPLASNILRVGVWVYLIPTRTGWSSNTTPPFNAYIAPYFGCRVVDSSGSPVTGQMNVGGSRIDGSGWYRFDFEFKVDTTNELTAAMVTGPYRFFIRLNTAGSTARYADYLIQYDHCCAGATCDPPSLSPPCLGAATTTEQDIVRVDGWASGANWSKVLRFIMPPFGRDSYTKQSYCATNRLCTLWQSGSPSRYISISLDTVNGWLVFTDGTNTATIGPANNEIFEFNHLTPITIGITKTDAGSGNSTMAFYVSVGGSQLSTTLVSGSLSWTNSDPRPRSTVLSDPAIATCVGAALVDDWMDESTALTANQMATMAAGSLVMDGSGTGSSGLSPYAGLG